MPDKQQKDSTNPPKSDRMSASERAPKSEIEILERKTKAMIALGHEILNRLQELKAA